MSAGPRSFLKGPLEDEMTVGKEVQAKKPAPDFALVFARMEQQILLGKNRATCCQILARESIWKSMGVEKQLRWARLAQIAGDVDTALKVLSHINHRCPRMVEAWVEHLELLIILDQRGKAAQLLAASKAFLDHETYEALLERCGDGALIEPDGDITAAAGPFEELRHRQLGVQRYLDLFCGREDCFARQWVNKAEQKQGYVPVRRPMEQQDAEEHLSGRKTYGIYLLRSDATVNVAVIDADLTQTFRQATLNATDRDIVKRERSYLFSRIKELGAEIGLDPLIEFSGGKGFHFWFCFEAPVEAVKAKRMLESIVNPFSKDLSAFNLEVFPKQGQLSGKGLGNLVKLPLGVHRVTGRRSYFVECHHRTLESQLDFLSNIRLIKPACLLTAATASEDKKVSVHPRWQKWAEEYHELFRLESMCPPLAQVIAACRNGTTMSQREEKVIFQTIGFLPRSKVLTHYLTAFSADYNPHMVDYKLSRLRGSPLGCKRIHSLLGFNGEMCPFDRQATYAHPLLHLEQWEEDACVKAKKVEDLSSAIDHLQTALYQVQRFLQ